jgi:HTH-type transcriptional repressor of NAD biosynthesis genes
MTFKHGVVAGKFYPFHKGHEMLIRFAQRQCDRLSVFVVWQEGQAPDGAHREACIRATFPDVETHLVVDLGTEDEKAESSQHWANYTRDILEGDCPDAVFSSEKYGEWWAKELGATHVPLSFNRTYWPISGTEIRNDPMAHFHMLSEASKPFYVKKVLIVGAESTGKTTLGMKLATAYSTQLVPEWGRIYVEDRGLDNTDRLAIFGSILNNQPRLEDEYIKCANRVLFCDTDLLTTSVWWDLWQHGNKSPLGRTIYNEGLKRAKDYDLILCMDPEGTEWVQDGFRDQQDTRAEFTQKLISRYYQIPVYPVPLTGTWDERYNTAVHAINHMLGDTQAVLPQPKEGNECDLS